jgi:hypothetical protein
MHLACQSQLTPTNYLQGGGTFSLQPYHLLGLYGSLTADLFRLLIVSIFMMFASAKLKDNKLKTINGVFYIGRKI